MGRRIHDGPSEWKQEPDALVELQSEGHRKLRQVKLIFGQPARETVSFYRKVENFQEQRRDMFEEQARRRQPEPEAAAGKVLDSGRAVRRDVPGSHIGE